MRSRLRTHVWRQCTKCGWQMLTVRASKRTCPYCGEKQGMASPICCPIESLVEQTRTWTERVDCP